MLCQHNMGTIGFEPRWAVPTRHDHLTVLCHASTTSLQRGPGTTQDMTGHRLAVLAQT